MRSDLLNPLSEFLGKRVLIVGDAMLDEYIWGETRRISPEAPVPIVELGKTTYTLGGAANVAASVVGLGGDAILAGVIGEDEKGDIFRSLLADLNIEDGVLTAQDRPTTTKTRVLARGQQVVRLDSERRVPLQIEIVDRLLRCIESQLPKADVCLLSDYDKGVVSTSVAACLISLAREAHKPVVVDPKGNDIMKFRGATCITPNVIEVERALNRELKDDTVLVEAGKELSNLLEGSALLITQGADGMSLFINGSLVQHLRSVAREVYDTTGAGDTVAGTLALALAADTDLERSVWLANRAAGVVVSKLGTSTLSAEELIADASL